MGRVVIADPVTRAEMALEVAHRKHQDAVHDCYRICKTAKEPAVARVLTGCDEAVAKAAAEVQVARQALEEARASASRS
jgi:hypothetical protein